MKHNRCTCVKLDSIAESLREVAAFEDALIDIISEKGVREGLRFIGDMVKDGYIPAIDGRALKQEIRRLAREWAA